MSDFSKYERLLPYISKPGRYIGEEYGIVKKQNASLKVCIAYPDSYEIGMANISIRILYSIINSMQDIVCERVFAPLPDFEALLIKNNLPLYSLESKRPLYQFDIIGFSLHYELVYTNILNILKLGQIPIYSRDRERHIVIAGGPATHNPLPIADFIDAFVIGDGEEVIRSMLDIALRYRGNKDKILNKWSLMEGIFIPSLHKDKNIKRLIVSINTAPYIDRQIVPSISSIQDKVSIEVSRGCINGCRFCEAGYIYRPVRERSIDKIIEYTDKLIKQTGYNEITLASLSIADYSNIKELINVVYNRYGRHISISLPSLRITSFDTGFIKKISDVKKSGITLAMETALDIGYGIINKEIDKEKIMLIIKEMKLSGYKNVKLYFMIGLPFLNIDDEVIAIADFLLDMAKLKININANVSTFVPRPHTPFQWTSQRHHSEIKEALSKLISIIKKDKRIKIKYHNPLASTLEGIIGRGDRHIGNVIAKAFNMGARFDGWDEYFDFNIWKKAFEIHKIDIDTEVIKAYKPEERLPWDFIDTGISKAFFISEYNRAKKGIFTNACYNKCSGCGLCNKKIMNEFHGLDSFDTNSKKQEDTNTNNTFSYILTLTKTGLIRFISHIEYTNHIIYTLRRAEIKLVYSSGFRKKPKISFYGATPLGFESKCEHVRIRTSRRYDCKKLIESFNKYSPPGIDAVDCMETMQGGFKEYSYIVYETNITSNMKIIDIPNADIELNENKLVIKHYGGRPSIREIIKSIFNLKEEGDICLLNPIKLKAKPKE